MSSATNCEQLPRCSLPERRDATSPARGAFLFAEFATRARCSLSRSATRVDRVGVSRACDHAINSTPTSRVRPGTSCTQDAVYTARDGASALTHAPRSSSHLSCTAWILANHTTRAVTPLFALPRPGPSGEAPSPPKPTPQSLRPHQRVPGEHQAPARVQDETAPYEPKVALPRGLRG
jgi:hypothetical protein